jgi:hypothetical protein
VPRDRHLASGDLSEIIFVMFAVVDACPFVAASVRSRVVDSHNGTALTLCCIARGASSCPLVTIA